MRKKPGVFSRERTPFEWALLAASALAILAAAVTLVVEGLKDRPAEPNLIVQVERGPDASGGVAYLVTVRNAGGTTAENVAVEVTLGDETREFELTAVAREDEETATVVFPPGATGEPTAQVLSYTESAR